MEKGDRYFAWGCSGVATLAVSAALGWGVGRFEANNTCNSYHNPDCVSVENKWARIKASQYMDIEERWFLATFLLFEGLGIVESMVGQYDKLRGRE
jgi:hypothetical protein